MSNKVATEDTSREILEAVKAGNQIMASSLLSKLDGTKRTYDAVMYNYFMSNGVKAMTSAGITKLCNDWYNLTRDGWDGYTAFKQPDVSAVSAGTRGGDNAGKTCTPSTDTVAGQDDFAGLPLFAVKNVNYVVDPDSLDIVITAIEGITDNYRHTDPEAYVGVMQMAGYHYFYENDEEYIHGYADHAVTAEYCEPLPEAVRVDGTMRPFVVHSKYMNSTVNGKMTSCAGLVPTAWNSHNTIHTLSRQNGTQYSGSTITDWSFLVLMTYIKYASLTLDGILQGCLSYNGQYYAQVAETGARRVIVPASTIIETGSSVIIGVYNGSSEDRNTAANYSVTGQKGAIVTAVETVTIEETEYKAVYVDTNDTFDTAANGNKAEGSTIISTFHWPTGSTDKVLGNDGSPISNTDGKYPCKLQGIEFIVGGYETVADTIMNIAAAEDGESYYTTYVVKRSAQQASSVTANYEAVTELAKAPCPASAGWQYIKKEGFAKGIFYPISVGGSSSTFTKDAFYMNAKGTTGTREMLLFGYLYSGVATGGLSFLAGSYALSTATWTCLARLSPNGNRGEWVA